MNKDTNNDVIRPALPIIVADLGTRYQIYNPLNMDTYFVDKDDFWNLALGMPSKTIPKSFRYIGIDEEKVEKARALICHLDEFYNIEKETNI